MVKFQILFLTVLVSISATLGRIVDKRKCPEVRAVPHFDLSQMSHNYNQLARDSSVLELTGVTHCDPQSACHPWGLWQTRPMFNSGRLPADNMLGDWYVVEYYASAEEALSYSCMKSVFREEDHVAAADGTVQWVPGVTMNFTYQFADDPLGENLQGNITWKVDMNEPAHWSHAESTYDGIYNTYVLDTEYKTWALLLHCAEKTEGTRYLTAFVLSRNTFLPKNVMAYLRDKLPRYDVDINYVFPIAHDNCSDKPARADYSPILVEVDSKGPKKPGVSYNVAY